MQPSRLHLLGVLLFFFHHLAGAISLAGIQHEDVLTAGRERLSLNAGWRFRRTTDNPDTLTYAKMKSWIMPSANPFIKNASKHYTRPAGQPANVSFAHATFVDSAWEMVDLPHDWAIKGPFYTGSNPTVGPGMGRLPSQGIGWYRRKFALTEAGTGKAIYLDVDGAMSYAMVWLNGQFVGGWPYGYASWRVELTPYVTQGDNIVAIWLDNAVDNSRWYPGAGIYRNVWLTKVHATHVGQTGTYIVSRQVSAASAILNLVVQVDNGAANTTTAVQVSTDVHVYDAAAGKAGEKVAEFPNTTLSVDAGKTKAANASLTLLNPQLWGPPPTQKPNMYVAVTRLSLGNDVIDTYQTRFGVRALEYKNDGLRVNGEKVYLHGLCQHHDLGSLGSAFNIRAAERQLEILQDMGANAIRTSHNPPAPELLDLTDRLGFVVLDEIFDTWNHHKTSNDFQTIFADWHEPDLRAFIRRDRNHPSVFAWSFGNELSEQSSAEGGTTARELKGIVNEEDPTRQTTVAMNSAGPTSALASVIDLIGLNYQGEGARANGEQYPSFRTKFPSKMLFSTESASAISSRGQYMFPVAATNNAKVSGSQGGGDPAAKQISAYDVYAVDWGASADRVFEVQDRYPYVAGEFVWTGWDYVGEPTPYDTRSSYFGIVDLAGFPKDRFYLYQSRWRPELRMAHVLPHWNWPDRVGKVTPVHVFSAGNEAELFLNGRSQGRQMRKDYTYRFRWDNVTYEPGELHVVTYKDSKEWASATVRTPGGAARLQLSTYKNRTSIRADGTDLLFVTAAVVDDKGGFVATATDNIVFSVKGPGEIVSTDNGDATDYITFPSKERRAFAGLALAIVKAEAGITEPITVRAEAEGLAAAEITVDVK
ncbi:glycoside hydrolase [Coniochaeta ligniaria NRRL 30616]|uniref:Glycoside hydrolase n=1 Tax=Coniochaeta ligniaria NRRL 30616 TaxID=1408157 RepID=A0A1J7JQ94_9PEZI|nr:glycoside hydrolase [Coniochaeta ligniaria NRRL 30616]